MWWLLLPIFLTIAVYYVAIKPFTHWQRRNVLQESIIRNLKLGYQGFVQIKAFPEIVYDLYHEFPGKRYYGAYPMFTASLILRDPELIKQLAVKDFDHFTDHVSFMPENVDPLWTNNLFALKGEKWKRMRATLSPSFTSSKMRTMFVLMSECAENFVNYFATNKGDIKSVDMEDVLTRYTNDVIATSAFGIKCDSLVDRNNDFYVMGKDVTGVFKGFLSNLKFTIIYIAPTIARMVGLQLFSKKVSAFFLNVIKRTIKTREENNIIRPDMVHLLMEARKGKIKNVDENGHHGEDAGFATVEEHLKPADELATSLTDEDITAQALIFFFAGFDTVSRQMCFVTYELALNPDIQDRLREEIDAAVSGCKGKITYEVITKLKYLDMVVSETLRKWPSAVMVDRVCVKPYTIKPELPGEMPVSLNVGDALWIPVYGLHRDPNHYPDPERFDPERFNDANKSSINPYAYLPFGVGARNCIGSRFALLEIKILIVQLLTKFKLVPVEKTPIPFKQSRKDFSIMSETGFHLGFEPRKDVALH